MTNNTTTDYSSLLFMEPIHVLGSGSIGLLFASSIRMAFPSYPIRLLLRPHYKHLLQKQQNQTLVNVSVLYKPSNRPYMVSVPAEILSTTNTRPIRNLFVSTKAPDAATAVRSIQERLRNDDSSKNNNGRIVILSNGALAIKEELSKVLGKSNKKIVLASTTHGAYREFQQDDDDDDDDDDMFHLVHAGVGKTFVQEEPQLAQLLDRAGLATRSVSTKEANINMWHKLAANCVINPTTALLGCENGDLLHVNKEYQTIMKEVLQEVSKVAIKDVGGGGEAPELVYPAIKSFVDQVIHDTLHNKSSMLQDVLRKQRTEIQYLNGHVVKCGKRYGIDTPANTFLCERIERLTESYIEK